jgi:membrane protease YdiL (CAAX protease family)
VEDPPEDTTERARDGAPRGPGDAVPGDPLRPAPPGRSLVPLALAFYALMLGAAALWATLSGDPLFYASDEAERRGVAWLRDAAAGGLVAAIAIVASREVTRRTRWGRDLALALGALLGDLRLRDCVLLALASGVAEEAFFRGALQPRIGLVAASLLFGLAHFAPRRDLAPWTVFSIAAGFVLGGLFAVTGNLLAPIVAHAAINAVNIRALTRPVP